LIDFRRAYKALGSSLWSSIRDLLPIVFVVLFFQLVVFRQPLENGMQLAGGALMVLAGLAIFITGLEIGLFPLGERMAYSFAKKGSLGWLLAFSFALGFGTTFAEPALISIAGQAAELSVSSSEHGNAEAVRNFFAASLRWTVAISVGLALVLGALRIIRNWPLHHLIIAAYLMVMLLTLVAPKEIIAIAYDAGGITTSTITVPLTTALGIGLASSIRGRNPLLDGFGIIALASVTPIIFVLIFGMVWQPVSEFFVADSQEHVAEAVGVISSENLPLSNRWLLTDVLISTVKDVAPIAIIIAFFQLVVLRQSIPNLPRILWGFLLVILGLAFFLIGLELALFPLGESMAIQLTQGVYSPAAAGAVNADPIETAWHAYYWTYIFAFAIGISTTIAEPSLIAVAMKAEEVSGGAIKSWGLRMAVAFGVGVGVFLGTLRIVIGVPLPYFILAGYLIVVIQTWKAPKMIIPLAYDSGGVTTSTVTVPLVTALGIGLASNIVGRDPVIDGFGLIAFASLMPMMTVMGYAQAAEWFNRKSRSESGES
jgi:hypothetical protein